MSENITCDVCGKDGHRSRGRHCPEGWFYAEYVSEDHPERGPIVIAVCSVECRERFWVLGPGDLKTSPSYILAPKSNRNVDEVFWEPKLPEQG